MYTRFFIVASGILLFVFGANASAEECICTMQYDPVCGVDGKTYGNACALACAGVTQAYVGECTTQIPTDPQIDATCTMWYDGCNSCNVVNGKIQECTLKYCSVVTREKCINYTYQILTSAHEHIIQKAIDSYLANRTGEQREQAKQLLLVKIKVKRAEIEDILMRSLFPVGSPDLRRYQLFLEVLKKIDSLL